MSSVVQRKRKMSELQFYTTALDIRNEVLAIVSNEKYIPKRKRLLIGTSTFGHAKNVVEFICMANAIYPYDSNMLFARKWYQQKAICMCSILIEDLRMIMGTNSKSQAKLLTVVDTIIKEIKLLRGWRNSSKILKHKGFKKIEEGQMDEQQFDVADKDTIENNAAQEVVDSSGMDTLLHTIILLEESWPIERPY